MGLPAKALGSLCWRALICRRPVLVALLQLRLHQPSCQLSASKAPSLRGAGCCGARSRSAAGPAGAAGLGPAAHAGQRLRQRHQRRLQPAKVCTTHSELSNATPGHNKTHVIRHTGEWSYSMRPGGGKPGICEAGRGVPGLAMAASSPRLAAPGMGTPM